MIMNDENYNRPPSDVHIMLIGITMAVVTGIVSIAFMFTEPRKENNKPESSAAEVVESTTKSTYVPYTPPTEPPTEPPTTLPAGFYPDNHNVYCVGDDYAPEEYYIPEGIYMLIANSDDSEAYFYKMGSEEENWQEEEYCSFQYSCIVKLEKGWDFITAHFDTYSLDTFDSYGIENNPFEHGGMFRVGIDVPAGTYRVVVTDEQDYRHWAVIYNDIDEAVDNDTDKDNLLNNETTESIEIKLKEGNILMLSGSILEEIS